MSDELDILFDKEHDENDFRVALNYPVLKESVSPPSSIHRGEIRKIFNSQTLRSAACFLASNFSLPNG